MQCNLDQTLVLKCHSHQKYIIFDAMYVCRNCHIMVSNVSRTIMYVVCCNNGSTTEFHQKEVIKHCTQKNSLHSAAIITLIFTSLQKYRMSCSTGKLNVRNYLRSQFPSFIQLMSFLCIQFTSHLSHAIKMILLIILYPAIYMLVLPHRLFPIPVITSQ